jgi:hypothetical protein
MQERRFRSNVLTQRKGGKNRGGDAMDGITSCVHCGKRLVPVPSADGRTELKCAWCDEEDPIETETAKWANSPLAKHITSSPSRGQ